MWRKSSLSNPSGNCVEFTQWQKSSHSNSQGNCVETSPCKICVTKNVMERAEVNHCSYCHVTYEKNGYVKHIHDCKPFKKEWAKTGHPLPRKL